MLAKAKRPSGLRSLNRFVAASWVMTRDTKDELLLIMLFLGFRFFSPSLTGAGTSAGFPSPKGGAVTICFEMKVGVLLRGLTQTSETLTPDVGGVGTVARGFGFIIGASDGCGGGVARCRSSLSS
jgi:hypothetical protein